ncbi:glycine--tRNA ligase subunit beta [Wolbachia pipientis]|uniref:Glycine--tRNA ligase beta subunit n=1 Tax=Wolbachia pipientis TaxID=955 RepID=A0A1E7QIY7_WOLPI|nr:glycine--tRNA ligase subunit beta [Wolbachia pipientis]OEY86441.1 glycine--tRNA ligase subunit beta [Wolbachia pipientis]
MPSQLLFECLSEEIPSRMHGLAVTQAKNYIVTNFSKNNIKFKLVEVYITARRIVLFVKDLDTSLVKNNEIKGPNVNAGQDALEGFLKKNKKNKEDLLTRKINGEDFYFIKKNSDSFDIKTFIKSQLEEMFKNFSWPKSMRWGEKKERWIRPIKSILCMLDNEVIPVSFAGITASNITSGHRFLSKDEFLIIRSPADYLEVLEENNVILNQDKRKKCIVDQINKFAQDHSLQLEKNEYLLNELTGLVEWPIVLFGKVNQEKSVELPKEVVLSIINTQQKYLALGDGHKIFYFATVVNVKNNRVIKGYEKILEARLADAQFLISQDKKHDLDYYVNKLDSILFHTSLGSVKEKVKRITAVSKYIAIWIPHASLIKVERTAHLAKADLATSMVREFPELQGIMGGHYAQEDEEIVESIIEHYKPIGPEQECPKTPSAIAVSLADKMDSLVGLVIAGEKASGSYDQFGLRRMSIGIIRIILENNLHIPIKLFIDKSTSLYSRTTSGIIVNKKQLVFEFLLERFKSIVKKENISPDIVNSILCQESINDLSIAKEQIDILSDYLNLPEGRKVHDIYKRVGNIVNKAIKDSKDNDSKSYRKRLLLDHQEIELANYAVSAYKNIKQTMKNHHFKAALDELVGFAPFVDQFMNNVKINCDSNVLRKNRLALLIKIISIFHLVANFSMLKVK